LHIQGEEQGSIVEAFVQIPKLAKELNILKVGTVSVDGTKIKANASIYKSIRYDRARELEAQLNLEIEELMKKAEEEDKVKDEKGDEVASELARLSDLRAKMKAAQKKLEGEAKERACGEQEEYEDKVRRRYEAGEPDGFRQSYHEEE
jgi:hypothetical protein